MTQQSEQVITEEQMDHFVDQMVGDDLMQKIMCKVMDRTLTPEILKLNAEKLCAVTKALEENGFSRQEAIDIVAKGEGLKSMFEFMSATMTTVSNMSVNLANAMANVQQAQTQATNEVDTPTS